VTKKSKSSPDHPQEQDAIPTGSEFDASASDNPESGDHDAQASLEAQEPESSELDDLRASADEYLEGWQRARAEFANYKKRIEREQAESRERITGEVLARFLAVLDDFELALKDRPPSGDAASWAEGIDLIYRKLKALLEAEGVEVIDAKAKPFDPNLHEALSYEEYDEVEDGHVIDVLRQGYKMGERVLRPALVRVAKVS
jgi:molecular chaperone GrpE